MRLRLRRVTNQASKSFNKYEKARDTSGVMCAFKNIKTVLLHHLNQHRPSPSSSVDVVTWGLSWKPQEIQRPYACSLLLLVILVLVLRQWHSLALQMWPVGREQCPISWQEKNQLWLIKKRPHRKLGLKVHLYPPVRHQPSMYHLLKRAQKSYTIMLCAYVSTDCARVTETTCTFSSA